LACAPPGTTRSTSGPAIRNEGERLLYEFDFPATEKTPRLARRALDGQLAYLGTDAESRMRLVMTEIVTNAIRHGHLDPEDRVHVTVDLTSDGARVEVRQATRAEAAIEVDRRDDGGYGLRLVDELTDAWGIEPGPPGIVWFEIGTSDDPAGPGG
jgi:two-component sensor histidine kinase